MSSSLRIDFRKYIICRCKHRINNHKHATDDKKSEYLRNLDDMLVKLREIIVIIITTIATIIEWNISLN